MYARSVALVYLLAVLAASACAAEISIEKMPYPGVVALLQDRPGIWAYKSFPVFLPLYIFDGEPPATSTCDQVCSAVWPIVSADSNAVPLGAWTIVQRHDGRRQWAYKGKPVYTYFEDKVDDPRGVGKEQDWFLNEAGVAYLVRAGVNLPSDFKLSDHQRTRTSKATAALLRP